MCPDSKKLWSHWWHFIDIDAGMTRCLRVEMTDRFIFRNYVWKKKSNLLRNYRSYQPRRKDETLRRNFCVVSQIVGCGAGFPFVCLVFLLGLVMFVLLFGFIVWLSALVLLFKTVGSCIRYLLWQLHRLLLSSWWAERGIKKIKYFYNGLYDFLFASKGTHRIT